MPPDRPDHVCMLSTRSATALYVGAVLGPGVMILPSQTAAPPIPSGRPQPARAPGEPGSGSPWPQRSR